MAITVPFQQQFTWRKLGYLYFNNSLSYREVLEQNPQWTVTELPPVGANLLISNSNGQAGTLSQGNTIFGLPTGSVSNDIFPFDTTESYTEALDRYTLQGVVERDTINGITLDSVQAITGSQNG